MVYARRHVLPNFIKTNKSGGVSLLSFIRALELADDVIFHVALDMNTKQLLLTPTTLVEIPRE